MEGAKHRTQISLEDWQYQMLLDLSRKTGKSLSAIIRGLIEEKVSRKSFALKSDPLFGIIGLAHGDGSAVSTEHDEYLYGTRK